MTHCVSFNLAVLKSWKCRWNFEINMDLTIYNLGQNICRLFHFLARFLFTASDTELDYYHKKKSVWVASRVPGRLMPSDLREFGNFKEIPEMLGFEDEYPGGYPKANFWSFLTLATKNQLQNIPQKNLFCLISWISLQPFVHNCRSSPSYNSLLRDGKKQFLSVSWLWFY